MTRAVLRAGAQQVACPTCHVAEREPCVNLLSGRPLHRPAHEPRLWAAVAAGHVVVPEALHPDEEFEP